MELAAHWVASRQRLQWVLQVSARGQTEGRHVCRLEGTLPALSHDCCLSTASAKGCRAPCTSREARWLPNISLTYQTRWPMSI